MLVVLAAVVLVVNMITGGGRVSESATSDNKSLSEKKYIEKLANGGQIIITSNTYKTGGWTGPGQAGKNLYEYVPPDSNIPEYIGASHFEGGGRHYITKWMSQDYLFIAFHSGLHVRLKDSTWHEFNFYYRDFPGRDTELGQGLLSLNANDEGYFEVINVGDENVWLPDFLVGSQVRLEESSMLQNNKGHKFYILVSYYDAKGRRILKYRMDITTMQLTLIGVGQQTKLQQL